MQLPILNPLTPGQDFPPIDTALIEPDGLLAAGGCLSSQRILNAYRQGIFPWFNPEEPILWWSPNPRLILFPEKIKVSRSLKKTLRKNELQITFDQAFSQVMQYCATPRKLDAGTWISEDMLVAYNELHQQGFAHSFEAWFEGNLVGGLYGISIGKVFFGESMFHRKTDASKIVFYHMVQQLSAWGFQLIDCQVHSNHLSSLGAEEIDRNFFSILLNKYCSIPPVNQAWKPN